MQVTTTKEINAPASAVWDLMGEGFGDISEWLDAVTKSTINGPVETGAVRICELKPAPGAPDTLHEKLTEFDPKTRRVAYDVVDGLPGFIRKVNASWVFEPAGGERTKVTNVLTMEVAWWMRPMLPMLLRKFQKTIAGIIPKIETAATRTIRVVEPASMAG